MATYMVGYRKRKKKEKQALEWKVEQARRFLRNVAPSLPLALREQANQLAGML